MATTPARSLALLYGSGLPGASMNFIRAPGSQYVQNRTFENNLTWITGARAAGTEVLWYANLIEYPITGGGGWTPIGEEARFYGNISGGWTNIPDSWWWTGSRSTASTRSEYAGQYMLNVRPNSPWWQYVLSWIDGFFTRQNGYFDGIFWDVIGNRLWQPIWNTMWATTDTYAGDGRKEAENWIRGLHWGVTQMRAIVGPEPIFIGNNIWDTDFTGGTSTRLITGGYASMQKGGHPGLNGCMFEGAGGGATTGQHSYESVRQRIAGEVNSSSPNGSEWATNANGRERFHILSSRAGALTDLQIYTTLPTVQLGYAPGNYESQPTQKINGTVSIEWDDHYDNWLYGGSVEPPPDPTPDPTAPAPPTVPPNWFGNRAIGVNKSGGMTADYIRGTRFLSDLNYGGPVNRIWVLLDGLGGGVGTQVLKLVLGNDTGGEPATIVATSSEVSIAAGANPLWKEFIFSTGSVLSGDSYYLFIHSGPTGGIARYYFDIAPGVQRLGPDTYSGGAASPVVAASVGEARISMYLDFTPVGTTTAVLVGSSQSDTLSEGTLRNAGAVEIPEDEVITQQHATPGFTYTRTYHRRTANVGEFGPQVIWDEDLEQFIQIEGLV